MNENPSPIGSGCSCFENAKERFGEAELSDVSFSTLVLSLCSSAMVQLGVYPDPDTGRACVNIPAAQDTLKLLELLRQKTKGNLTNKERDLLDESLACLHHKYEEANT